MGSENGVYGFRRGTLRGVHPSVLRARALARAGAPWRVSWGEAAVGAAVVLAAFLVTRWVVRQSRVRVRAAGSDYLRGVDIAAG